MYTLLSSTRWTDEEPAIYVSATYETRKRTSETVDVRVVVSVSAVNGLSYFGYNIQSCIEFPGLTTDWVRSREIRPANGPRHTPMSLAGELLAKKLQERPFRQRSK